MFTRAPELCKVVGLTPQFPCMPQGMVSVNSVIYPIKYSTNYRQCVMTVYELHADYSMFFQVSCFTYRLFSYKGHVGKNGNMPVTEERTNASNRFLYSYYIA
jgi:hypothetical protein